MTQKIDPLKLMISIVDRGLGKKLISHFNQEQITQHVMISGRGTASSEVLDVLGLDTLKKDIIFSYSTATTINQLFHDLKSDVDTNFNIRGITCSIALKGMNQLAAIAIAAQTCTKNGKEFSIMDENQKYNMIIVTVNSGSTDDVMKTAREAGARGGTVIHARWMGEKSIESFYGISVQEEKEVIMIISTHEKSKIIMSQINEKHGLKHEAQAVICSLPVDQVANLN